VKRPPVKAFPPSVAGVEGEGKKEKRGIGKEEMIVLIADSHGNTLSV